MTKILLVEDDTNLAGSLEDYLTREGYDVQIAATLKMARERLSTNTQLLILDWMLPDGQGIDFLRDLRQSRNFIPTILLSARVDLVDKVSALEIGANDYITKPFEARELLARVRVQLRAAAPNSNHSKSAHHITLSSSGIHMDLSTREVSFENDPRQLSKIEFDLLKLFLENPNQVFSRDELLNKVWGYDSYPTTRTVDTHMLQLRQKFRDDLFETLRGIGYRFHAKI